MLGWIQATMQQNTISKVENNASLENKRFKSRTTGVNYTSKRLQNPWPNYESALSESRACV